MLRGAISVDVTRGRSSPPRVRDATVPCGRLPRVVRLVRADLALLDAALAGDDALAEALGHDVVAGWVTFTAALPPTRAALAANPGGSAWGARLFVAGDPPELVGWGGFKGPPRQGVVEVGYEIAEPRRGRGLATAATRAMLAEAFADERVTTVIAHTLPERNASNRVLEKAGFRLDGEAQEDGEVVWRFSLTRTADGV
jgi:RimJ/RimL family protein N-acetyltransferase